MPPPLLQYTKNVFADTISCSKIFKANWNTLSGGSEHLVQGLCTLCTEALYTLSRASGTFGLYTILLKNSSSDKRKAGSHKCEPALLYI